MLARIQSNRDSHLLWVGMQNGVATSENSLSVSYEAKYNLNHNPGIVPLNIYPTNLIYIHVNVYRENIIAKNWNNLRCSSVSDWINKLWYIHSIEYSAINRNKLLS